MSGDGAVYDFGYLSLPAEVQAALEEHVAATLPPVRQESLHGEPKPWTDIERTCQTCGASFPRSSFLTPRLRGIWGDWRWYCSVECAPAAPGSRTQQEGEQR